MGENQALAQFAAGDEEEARRAFDLLTAGARPFLHAYLRRTTGLTMDQREDVVQDTLGRAWQARGAYRNEGSEAWRGFLKVTARHCCVDLLRRRTEAPLDGDVVAETISGECVDALGVLMDALDAETLCHQADVLWLGLDPTLPLEDHRRRLLAAQLLYLDGLPWDRVCRLLGPARPGEPPLTRATLNTWLSDAGVLRHLAYQTLHYANSRLAGRLLGFDDTLTEDELNALSRSASTADGAAPAPVPGGWTWTETAVILWRYRHALLFEQILLRADCTLPAEVLRGLLDRTVMRFPFSSEMVNLLAAVGTRRRCVLEDRGLWQRLAFQYRYADGLPHQDIRDRTQPAYRHVADPARPEITLGMLNVWLSNGRLLERLARACRGLGGGQDDE